MVPRAARFYELFEKEAALVSESLRLLSSSLLEGKSEHPRLRELEHECDDVARDLYNLANVTFTPPMDPEDILRLAHALDGIVDLAEEVSDKLDLYKAAPTPNSAKRLGQCLAEAGAALENAVRNIENPGALGPALHEVHRIENDGDRITREALQQLFNGNQKGPAEVIKWKDLYDLLEATIDQCESVAEMIETIAVKNS